MHKMGMLLRAFINWTQPLSKVTKVKVNCAVNTRAMDGAHHLDLAKPMVHALPAGSTLDDLFALIPRAAIVDICQLSRRFQAATGREWLTGTVMFDPSVWVGNIGASPDVRVRA